MASAEGSASAQPGTGTDERRELGISVALVTALAVVHLALAYFISSLPAAIFDTLDRQAGQPLSRLMVDAVPWVPLALVVLYWARSRRLAWIAWAVMGGAVLLEYFRGVAVRRLLDNGEIDAALDVLDTTGWVMTAVMPVVAALAWGLARRLGPGWWPGLLVAALLALLLREFEVTGPTGAPVAVQAMVLALLYQVIPAVLGGLACWWLEIRRTTE
jgi:hypothetical protein